MSEVSRSQLAGDRQAGLAAVLKPASQAGADHREGLRVRLLAHGPDGLLDHELVEMLLSLSDRRGDARSCARVLLDEFGSIGAVLNAEHEALRKTGLSDATIGAIRLGQALALRLLRAEITKKPILAVWSALLDYLHADMAYIRIERVRALYLDGKSRLICDEVLAEGSVDQAAVYVREVVRRALALQASAIILVHNHPSGDPTPSRADIQLTRDLVQAMKPLNIVVHDHVVIGADGHSSLRAMGVI